MRHTARLFFTWLGLHNVQPIARVKKNNVPPVGTLASIACVTALAVQMLAAPASAQQPRLAPITNADAPNRIPGQYIVVFKPGTARNVVAAAQERVKGLGGTVMHTYTSALVGFSVKMPAEAARAESAMQALRALPEVDYIEVDQVGNLNTIQPPNPAGAPPTGIDRVDRRLLPLNGTYTYSETGANVHVYVIDTGIHASHVEFGGRVSGGTNTMNAAAGTDDCHGHGTHVSGIIGASTFGIAKQVFLHPVRAGDCANTYLAPVIAAVDWVTNNRVLPAVVNLSSGFGPSAALQTAVTNSIAAPSNVTYAVAAGNANADACNTSPALVPTAITVGAVDPTNDTRAGFSNFGTCVDLFAPGVNILSTWNTSNTATNTLSGTSMAAPHVAGVAARYLQTHPAATPAMVWAAIHNADDIFPTTASWPGVINPGAGSPNELLHWGSLNDGFNDGDPHLTTVDGTYYDFQSAGEFVMLRDGNGLQIQTRQTPVPTAPPVANGYTGLTSCVSVNTAVAARVGTHRVTYQPNISGVPDPSGMQLRVDGALATLVPQGIALGPGGRVAPSSVGSGIQVDFPDGTNLTAIPNWWPSQSKWYLTVSVYQTRASEGVMGAISPGGWLPAIPNGSSLGPKPAALHQRFIDLNQTFANAWRVSNATSLFDYAPGTSTATFTNAGWPPENPPCVVPQVPPAKPVNAKVALELCSKVTDKNRKANCVFDVGITGEAGFVKSYLLSQRLHTGATKTTVYDDKDPSRVGDTVTFTAIVTMQAAASRAIPTGTVQFMLDGKNVRDPIKLDSKGRAIWKSSLLEVGEHQVAAEYAPAKGSVYLPSTSLYKPHAVTKEAAR